MELASVIGIAVMAFASTNIDDLFVLIGFYADPEFDGRDIVVGQFLGIAALFVVSVVVSLAALAMPGEYLRLLGLGPILVGGRKLWQLRRGRAAGQAALETHPRSRTGSGWLTVASMTIANGGDNIGVYAPLFATRSASALLAMGVVFAIMTAVWCGFGYWLVGHPTLGTPLRRHGHRIMPIVLIGIGALILLDVG